VFVAGDLLWYPVEGNIQIRAAPDAMVVFGRPPGYRGSYVQCHEDGIAPQVTFEVLSPSNTRAEMRRKLAFYEAHGVEEYYEYDPDRGTLKGWWRRDGRLEPIVSMEGWISPRLGIRFSLEGTDLVLYRPDGRRFETFVELDQRAQRSRAEGVQEGLQQGLQEGLQQGLQEGLQQGLQEGLQQGLQEGLQQALERLIASGMAEDQARRLLGLA
jgi:flagellar biosynthesis/type III secretory pathway protein FliH